MAKWKDDNLLKESRMREWFSPTGHIPLKQNPSSGRYDFDGNLTSQMLSNFVAEGGDGFTIDFGVVSGDFNCSSLGLTSLKGAPQEIDGDFLGSGNSVFDLADIKAIEDCLPDYLPIKKRYNGQYLQFEVPDRDKEYFIGADVATGRATDYSSFTCMDREGEEQAVYKGKMPVDKYAKLLGDTGEYYNFATLAPESNDVGLAVTSFLQTEGYPKLYFYQKMVKAKGKSRPDVDKSPGWLTTNKNRSVIIDGLENDVRNEVVTIKDPFFVQEAYTFIYDSLGRPVAMGKHKTNQSGIEDLETEVYADDDIMGKAICNHIRKGKTNIIVTPK